MVIINLPAQPSHAFYRYDHWKTLTWPVYDAADNAAAGVSYYLSEDIKIQIL